MPFFESVLDTIKNERHGRRNTTKTFGGGVMLALANLADLGRCAAIEEKAGDSGEFDPTTYIPKREGE